MKSIIHSIFCFIFVGFFHFGMHAAPVLVLTHAYNRPEYIRWQDLTLKKFLKDEYQFIVFNDAPNNEHCTKIHQICSELNISCIDIPQQIHDYKNPYLQGPNARNPLGDASAECAETIQYMMDTLGFQHEGVVVILDSDMFLIRDLSINNAANDYAVVAHPQLREGDNGVISHFLPNLIFFNMAKLQDKYSINFNVGIIDNVRVDTGGFTHFYIKDHPDLKWLRVNCEYQIGGNTSSEIVKNFQSYPYMYQVMCQKKYDFEFYYNFTFIHFRGGSNWDNINRIKFEEKERVFFEGLAELVGIKSL